MRHTTLAALCLTTATATAVLTGCGTLTKPADGKPKGPFADLSGQEIVDKAVKATTGATSLTVKGDVPDGKDTIKLDMALDRRGECAGSMSMNGQGTVDLVKTGRTVYMKYDEAFLRAQGKGEPASETDAVVEMLADRWAKTSATSSDAKDLASFCDLDSLLADFKDVHSAARKGAETTVDGVPAFTLTENDGKDRYTIYVATQGKPYLLKIENTSAKTPEVIAFSDYDQPVPAQAPKDKDIVDLDKLGS